ncbi:hypothetical protein [Saccharothrix sp. Mg75]|uniref:hypothetical protein n=1 Tax=Saccharothrix sp. Mg75 TaxID=3445357 RepID=UPI003EEC7B73
MRSALVVLAAVAVLLGALPAPGWVVRRPAERPDPARAAGITITYRVDAVSRIAKLGSDLAIGPGTLVAEIDLIEGTITGDLRLPPAHGYFVVFGFVPTTARTDLVPVGRVTGRIREGEITAHADLTIGLGEVAVNSQPLDVGQACLTTAPASVDLTGPFDLAVIRMKAAYAIPPFGGCRGGEDLDPLMTGLVSGPDNLLDLTLTAQL